MSDLQHGLDDMATWPKVSFNDTEMRRLPASTLHARYTTQAALDTGRGRHHAAPSAFSGTVIGPHGIPGGTMPRDPAITHQNRNHTRHSLRAEAGNHIPLDT